MSAETVAMQFHLTPSQLEIVGRALITFIRKDLGMDAKDTYNPVNQSNALVYFCQQYLDTADDMEENQ